MGQPQPAAGIAKRDESRSQPCAKSLHLVGGVDCQQQVLGKKEQGLKARQRRSSAHVPALEVLERSKWQERGVQTRHQQRDSLRGAITHVVLKANSCCWQSWPSTSASLSCAGTGGYQTLRTVPNFVRRSRSDLAMTSKTYHHFLFGTKHPRNADAANAASAADCSFDGGTWIHPHF